MSADSLMNVAGIPTVSETQKSVTDTDKMAGPKLPRKTSFLDKSTNFLAFNPQSQQEFNKEAVNVVTDWANGYGPESDHWAASVLENSLENEFKNVGGGRGILKIDGVEYSKDSLRMFLHTVVNKSATERSNHETNVLFRVVDQFHSAFENERPNRSPVPGIPGSLSD